MKPLLRTLGVAVLAMALMNASAGLCFCHRGPVLPGEAPGSGGCCHGPEAPGSLVVKAASSCCQVESAEASAVPSVAAHGAPPIAPFSLASRPAVDRHALAVVATALSSSSPPVLPLRI
jgi:hypothetical protein